MKFDEKNLTDVTSWFNIKIWSGSTKSFLNDGVSIVDALCFIFHFKIVIPAVVTVEYPITYKDGLES